MLSWSEEVELDVARGCDARFCSASSRSILSVSMVLGFLGFTACFLTFVPHVTRSRWCCFLSRTPSKYKVTLTNRFYCMRPSFLPILISLLIVFGLAGCKGQNNPSEVSSTVSKQGGETSTSASPNRSQTSLKLNNSARNIETNAAPLVSDDPGRDPLKPELVVYSKAPLLQGFLYRPIGDGPFPAVVFNHGSEPHPPNFGGQARFYVPHGYIVFAPHGRGHGKSAQAATYRDDILGSRDVEGAKLVALLEEQSDDIVRAIDYVRSLPQVDKNRVVVAGCSLGGIQSMLMAERGEGVRAALNFSGGSIVWATSEPIRERMTQAAQNARVPVFFIQAENDFDTAPSLFLSQQMEAAKLPHRVRIFPPHGDTPRQGHAFCAGGTTPGWGSDVLAFLEGVFQEQNP